MNKNTTLKVIKSYIAVQYNISEKELDSSGIIYVNNDKTDNSIKIISWFDKLVIFVSNNLKEFIKLQLKDKNREEIFEFPYIYGQSIYFIPDFEKVEKLKEPDEFIFKFFFEDSIVNFEKIDNFENSITFNKNGKCISKIAYCMYKNNKLIGIGGADEIYDKIWEVGIDIIPEYRNKGLSKIIMKNLTFEILNKNIIPIWCAASTNIASQAAAYKSGYIPLWVTSFGTIGDKFYKYNNLIKIQNNISNK